MKPDNFDHDALVAICRTLQAVDPRFDAKLAASLISETSLDTNSILRVLAVLDEVSPGRAAEFILTHLQRESAPAVVAKTALVLGRRVSNPKWVERQLASEDPRLRANVIQSMWGIDTFQAKGLRQPF